MLASRSHLVLAVAATLALGAFAGCVSAEAKGVTALYVTDAPADDLSHLYVTFDKVQVHQMANKTNENDKDDDDDGPGHANVTSGTSPGTGRVSVAVEVDEDDGSDDGQWITVSSGNVTVDLKALNGSNGASAFLGDAEVPVGRYNQIRLTVVEATAVWTNGTQQDVKVPGHAIRIKGHFTVEQDKETRLTLDFDLSKSLVKTGNGKLILKPVIRMDSERREKMRDDERRERMREREERSMRERKERDHDDD